MTNEPQTKREYDIDEFRARVAEIMARRERETAAADVRAEALRGPWVAVIADRYGFVYDSVADALENVEDPEEEVRITVVRGTALPNDRDEQRVRLRLPGSYHSGDKAYELDDVYLDDPDDPSVGADARFEQAKAMAAGLNRASAEG